MSLLLISKAYSFSDDEYEEIVASESKTKEDCNAYESFENTAKAVKKFNGKNKLRHRIAKKSPKEKKLESPIPDLFAQWPFKQLKMVFNLESENNSNDFKERWKKGNNSFVFYETIEKQVELKQTTNPFLSTGPTKTEQFVSKSTEKEDVFSSVFTDLLDQMENESVQKMDEQHNISSKTSPANRSKASAAIKKKVPKGKTLVANQCLMCFKKFSRPHFLETHILTHIGEKPFSCSNCGKSFADSINLKRHQRIHSGEKPFQCSVCSERFRQSNNLKLHEHTHTEERPYQCIICCKRFALSKNLKAHERVHTKEKPFECRLCGKRFTWRNTYKRHIQSHNKIEN